MKKNSIWVFTVTHRNQFDKIRPIVSENMSLTFFDITSKTKITCDWSKFGISATLEQNYNNISILLLLNQAHAPLQRQITVL